MSYQSSIKPHIIELEKELKTIPAQIEHVKSAVAEQFEDRLSYEHVTESEISEARCQKYRDIERRRKMICTHINDDIKASMKYKKQHDEWVRENKILAVLLFLPVFWWLLTGFIF